MAACRRSTPSTTSQRLRSTTASRCRAATLSHERKTGNLMKSPFKFKKYGQSGIEVSEIFPHLGECVDDMCIVKSVYTEIPNHEPALEMMNTGANFAGRPSMGSWLTYGLGSTKQESSRLRRPVPRCADHSRPAALVVGVSLAGLPGHLCFRQDREGGLRSAEADRQHSQRPLRSTASRRRRSIW